MDTNALGVPQTQPRPHRPVSAIVAEIQIADVVRIDNLTPLRLQASPDQEIHLFVYYRIAHDAPLRDIDMAFESTLGEQRDRPATVTLRPGEGMTSGGEGMLVQRYDFTTPGTCDGDLRIAVSEGGPAHSGSEGTIAIGQIGLTIA